MKTNLSFLATTQLFITSKFIRNVYESNSDDLNEKNGDVFYDMNKYTTSRLSAISFALSKCYKKTNFHSL